MSDLSPLISEFMIKGNDVIFTVTGNSMAPMLHHRRDKVCIVKPPNKLLKKYDIPLFVRKDGKYILHRIISVRENGYVTIGDNQCIKEYPVMPSQVIGVVKGFWRSEKYISCESIWYRTYCRIWYFIYPVRWIYLRGIHIICKLKNSSKIWR